MGVDISALEIHMGSTSNSGKLYPFPSLSTINWIELTDRAAISVLPSMAFNAKFLSLAAFTLTVDVGPS